MDVERRILYSVEKSTSSAWVTLFYAIGYNMIMLGVVLLSYGLGHRWPFWRRMISPRNAVGERHGFTKPFFSLAKTLGQVIRTTEEELILKSGVDSASYIRFFVLCIQVGLHSWTAVADFCRMLEEGCRSTALQSWALSCHRLFASLSGAWTPYLSPETVNCAVVLLCWCSSS